MVGVIPYPRMQLKLTPKPALQLRFLPAAGGGDVAGKVNRSGDTMTGTLLLAHDPVVALEAATKSYVDANAGGISDAPANGQSYGRNNNAWALVQPLDGDLTALAALAGTNTIYYRNGINSWASVTIGANMSFVGGVLSSSGSGGSTTPGGSSGQVQFNDLGGFGGAAQLFYDKANGYVGIGTSAPSARFHVANDASSVDSFLFETHTSGSAAILRLFNHRGAQGSKGALLAGDAYGQILFNGADGSFEITAASISANMGGKTPGSLDMPGTVHFGATPDGGFSVAEVFSYDGQGNVILGSRAALATGAVDGFVHIESCPGTPTGVATTFTGMVPMVYDTVNNRLMAYSGARWQNAGGVAETLVALVDGATVPLDASLGRNFKLLAAGNRTILAPSNPPGSGFTQKITIMHEASGGARTLSLTGGAGGFRFGTDLTALTPTPSGLVDYIGAIWNQSDNVWDVVSYARGF